MSEVTRILDERPDIINDRGELPGHTGLRTALHSGVEHEPVVRILLERGADPNIRDEGDNAFPVHFAAERQDMRVIRLLVEHGAQTVAGEVDDHELDIIGWATAFDYVTPDRAVVDYLLAHGARHTMFSAVAVGDTDAIRAIVAHAPEQLDRAMDRTNHRRRPLHLAVVKKQPAAVETLLALGADVDATDAAGLTALDQAALDGGREMAQALIAGGATIRLASAIFLERHEDVARLLREDPDCLKPGGRWSTLIVRAAGRAPGHLVAALITNGAAVNMIDDEHTAVDQTARYTPLHAAAWEGNLEAAAVLLEHGADPRIRDTKYLRNTRGMGELQRQGGVS